MTIDPTKSRSVPNPYERSMIHAVANGKYARGIVAAIAAATQAKFASRARAAEAAQDALAIASTEMRRGALALPAQFDEASISKALQVRAAEIAGADAKTVGHLSRPLPIRVAAPAGAPATKPAAEQAAITRVWEANRNRLEHEIATMYFSGDLDPARDVVAATITKALRSTGMPPSLQPAAIANWLRSIGRTVALDELRGEARQRKTEKAAATEAESVGYLGNPNVGTGMQGSGLDRHATSDASDRFGWDLEADDTHARSPKAAALGAIPARTAAYREVAVLTTPEDIALAEEETNAPYLANMLMFSAIQLIGNMCLSGDELAEVTGKSRPSAQARALNHLGITHKRRPDGTVLVHRDHFDRLLGAASDARRVARPEDTEPNWGQ